jgi:hypothetical protein
MHVRQRLTGAGIKDDAVKEDRSVLLRDSARRPHSCDEQKDQQYL